MQQNIETYEQFQKCVHVATNSRSIQSDSVMATSMLDSMCCSSSDGGSQFCVKLLKEIYYDKRSGGEVSISPFDSCDEDQKDRAAFFAFTTLQRTLSKQQHVVSERDRVETREIILHLILKVGNNDANNNSNECRMLPQFLRTKIAVVLSRLIQNDFPQRWQNAFDDLIQSLVHSPTSGTSTSSTLEVMRKDIFLRTLQAFRDDVVEDVTMEQNTVIKDVMRGWKPVIQDSNNTGSTDRTFNSNGPSSPVVLIPPEKTVSARILEAIFEIFNWSHPYLNNASAEETKSISSDLRNKMPILAIGVFKGFISWLDLALVCNEKVLQLFFSCLSASGSGLVNNEVDDDGSPASQLAVKVTECLIEIISRGMEEEKKLEIIIGQNLLERIHGCNLNFETIDGTHILVMIQVAELINAIGQVLVLYWEERFLKKSGQASNVMWFNDPSQQSLFMKVLQQLMSLFFKCFAYDDIDVSGAVIPLASQLVLVLQKEVEVNDNQTTGQDAGFFRVSEHLPRLLSVMYQQMHYPSDYDFDYEDEDNAEEEMYRTELRKLNQKVIRICPELSLQFLCEALSNVRVPLSSAPTAEIEAALRLIFHFSEGIRPPPGTKYAMKSETFRDVLVALHRSDVSTHPHHEVLLLYYDISVRYCGILKDKTELLSGVLGAITGERGLQHPQSRVRSRSCYFLLKLVKAMKQLMRPYVETAIGGIQGLLSNPSSLPLEPSDSFYLFETIGILLSQTGLDLADEQRYLTEVMKPHVKRVQEVLASANLQRDPEHFSHVLSCSVAAITYISKAYTKRPSQTIQMIFAETMPVHLTILTSLPSQEPIRNKVMIYLQRMILCLGEIVLTDMPHFLAPLIEHCDENDIQDVGQILYQLCIKLKSNARPTIDTALLPFLRKIHMLMQVPVEAADQGQVLSHVLVEQSAIQKHIFVFLYTVVCNDCASTLISPTNLPHVEGILKTMEDGATSLVEPTIQKTCLQFFTELINQWGAQNAAAEQDANLNAFQSGFLQFVFDDVIPRVLESMLQPSFDDQDAMQRRNLREMSAMLSCLKAKRGINEFDQKVIQVMSTRLRCPINVASAFHEANTPTEMESCLKELLSVLKQR